MKLMTTTNESMESLRSIARSLWRLGIISTILLFSHTLSAQCEWTVHVWGSTWGDEVQWTLKNSSGSTLLSGGNYLSGFDDEQSVMADGPLTFWISNDGFYGDNEPNYEVSNGFEPVASGQLTFATSVTAANLECAVFDDCAGIPSAGTVGDDILVCSGISFVLSTANASEPANGLTRTWQSSPAGQDTWTDIPNSSPSDFTLLNGISAATDYRYSVFCDASQEGDISDIIQVNLKPANECYCTPPTPTYTDLYSIESVSTTGALIDFANLNTGFASNGYGDYSSTHVVSTAPAEEFTLTVANQNGATPGITVWIDWNQNGSFESSEEVFFTTTGSTSSLNTYTIPITVPVNALTGNTIMRIRNYGTTGNDPCGSALYGEVEDYGIEVITLDACVGTPNVPTVNGPSTICANIDFMLTVTGASEPAEGLTRQWQSSTDGNSWADIANAINSSYTANISQPTYFRLTMNCEYGGDEAVSNAVFIDISPANVCYCIPEGTNTSRYISNFSTSDAAENISNLNSGFSDGGYGDFTAMQVIQVKSESVSFEVDIEGGTFGFRIWVDWNQDGNFSANEAVYQSSSYGSSHSGSFVVPTSALEGPTRMRIASHWLSSSGDVDPCETGFTYGEFEDYTFNVFEMLDCDGTPDAGVVSETDIEVCPLVPFFIATEGASLPANGLTRTWQSSPAGQDQWTDVPNSSSSSIVIDAGVSEATDFRYVLTCDNNQQSDESAVIHITLKAAIECYCEPSYSYTGDYVSSIATVGAEQNISYSGSSANSGGQNIDETNQVVQVYAGQQITLNTAYVGGSQTIGVWADWNQDGFFGGVNDASEQLALNYAASPQSFTLLIPQSVTPGQYRLRVRGSYGNQESDGDAFACNDQSYGTTVDFTLEVYQLDDCVGIPTAGDVETADFSICAGEPFSLTVADASAPANGLIRIWQSSPAGEDEWTDLPNTSPMTFHAPNGVLVDTDFRYSVTCEFSDESNISDIIQVTLSPGTECYCDVAGLGSWGSISYVEFSGIENESGPATYTDFTDQTGYVVPGVTYPLTVKVPPGYASTEKVMVWVDWNQNGFFEESEYTYLGECSGNACGTEGITGVIAVPHSAMEGVTRMRIMSTDGSEYTDACGNSGSFYGEVEDYSIEVQIGDCTPPNFDYVITNNCDDNDTYNVVAVLNDFGTNSFVTVAMTRSDGVQVFPVTISNMLPIGFNFQLINNVPAGVTVTAAIQGVNPVCDISQTWLSMGCYCIPTFNYTGDYVSSISTTDALSDISFTGSSANNGGQYLNLTDSILEVYPGQQITLNTAYVGGSQTIGVWADWSKDGIFGGEDNANERLVLNYAASPQSFVINIPENLPADDYRLRVRGSYSDQEADGDDFACNEQNYGSAIDFTIQVIQLDDCEGTPFAGTLEEDNIQICAGLPFSLSTLDATEPANGLSRTWQSSPAGQDIWTDITNSTAPNFTVADGIMEDTDFRYSVTCSFSDQTVISDVVEVTLKPGNQCYCIPPAPSFTTLYWIESVSTTGAVDDFANMNTGWGDNSGYNDYSSSHTAVVAPDDEFTLNVVNRSGGSPGITVWIDWNQNGIFESSEQIYHTTSGTSSAETTYNITVTVPSDALVGPTNMRIRNYGSSGNDPCASASYGEVEDYGVEVITLDACVGTPDAGNVNAPSEICPGDNFTLTITGASEPAEGLTRQWQSSSDGDVWVDIAGAVNSSYSTTILQPTYFRITMNCVNGGDEAISAAVFVDLSPGVDCYCIPTGASATTLDEILNFSLSNLDHDSPAGEDLDGPGYSDYTDIASPAILEPGESYIASLTSGTGSGSHGAAIWIDYNDNGLFEASEKVAFIGSTIGASSTVDFPAFVPPNLPGLHRLRVQYGYNNSGQIFDPCTVSSIHSETEDYMVQIVTLDPCVEAYAGYVDSTGYNVCANSPISLTSTGATDPGDGLIRNWESSPAGQNQWTDIPGAFSATYTLSAGIDVPTDFRYKVTCSYSQESDVSLAVTVGLKPANECYCTPPEPNNTTLYWIESVSTTGAFDDFANLNTGFAPNGYGDYSNTHVVSTAPAEEFTLTVANQNGATPGITVWIDWNQDGSFESSEEVFFTTTGSSSSLNTYTIPITVPVNALTGNTVMRIRNYGSTGNDPCGSALYGEVEDYGVAVITLDACVGTPNVPTVNGPSTVCADIDFMLTVTGASEPAEGLTRQWQSSADGDNWADIANATNSSYTGNISQPTYFRLTMSCEYGGDEAVSNAVFIDITPASECYCIPEGTNTSRYISDFSTSDGVDNISNMNSGFSAGGYGEFTDMELTQVKSQNVGFEVDIVGGTAGFRIWVDWNQDGNFSANEVAYQSSSYDGSHSGSFTVPASALEGSTRMRIASHWLSSSGDVDPCETGFTYGEFEDYTFNVIEMQDCDTPIGGTIDNTTLEVCASVGFDITVTGASPAANGLERIWQSSPAGQNTWTDIAGATSSTYSNPQGITDAIDYRFKVTCTFNQETDVSNVVSVSLKPATACYCTPAYSTGCTSGDRISNVNLVGESVAIDNNSQCSADGYGDYTNLPAADLAPGETYTVSVSTDYSSPNYEQVKIWIDYNQNGIFDSNEEIANTNGNGLPNGTESFDFMVPEDLNPGNYTMRVRLGYGSGVPTFDPCNSITWGETEDYMVEVITLDDCVDAFAGYVDTTGYNICPNTPISLIATGASDPADGLTRNWQSSPAGQDQWTDISEASSSTFTYIDGIDEPTDFRFSVACTFSGESDVTDVLTIGISPANECYCTPTTTGSSAYISGFTATGDSDQNITNTNTGSSLDGNGFSDYTDLPALKVNAAGEVNFTVNISGGTAGVRIWVDWNQDGQYDSSEEVVYSSSSYSGTQTGSFTAPAEDFGIYRFRVGASYVPSDGPADPCGLSSSGEYEDYTLEVLEPVWDCPEISANIGSACDDGDPLTVNDTVNANCECVGVIPPAGSYCASAIPVECNASIASYNSANSIASNTTSCSMGSNGLWFSFEGTGLDITVTTTATFNHEMSINMGDNCDALTSIACVDGGVGDESYTIENSVEGTNYYVYVAHWSSSGTTTGTIGISITCEETVFDCPDIEANIGDDCYDDAGLPGVIDENCGCYVETAPEFDCPELEANIGDACELADGTTGVINDDCECDEAVIPACDMVYYLSDHDAADGISDIYQVTLSGGVATMSYIETSPIEVHIAYNPVDNMLYAISKHENSYRTLDPVLKIWGAEVALGDDLGQVTAAVFNHDGKLLLGSQNHKVIYSVNVNTNVVSTYDTFAPVYGGDLAYRSDGMLYLATRSGNGLYEVWSAPMNDQLIGILPPKVTGMAITDADQLLISAQGQTSLVVRNTDGSDPSVSYSLMLDGEAYTLRDGDMASGCNTRPPVTGYCDNFTTYYVNHGPDIDGSDLYKVNFTVGGTANLQFVTNVSFEAHIAFNAQDNLVYLVNADGSIIRIYDAGADSFVTDLTIGGSFTKLTAALYNANDGLLYIGDHHANEIHTVDLTTGAATYYADGPVSGGDLEILDNGDIYLATRQGAALYEIVSGGPAVFVGNIPALVTGIARANDSDDSFMLSNKNTSVFTQVSAIDGSTIETYNIMLNGVPFTTTDGDMAAGCADQLGDDTPPVDPFTSAVEATSNLTSYPNPTNGPSKVVFTTVETTRTLVEVYDMNGRNVATLFDQEAQKDQQYTLDFNGSKLPNGVYIYRLTTKNETIIEKFMIAR